MGGVLISAPPFVHMDMPRTTPHMQAYGDKLDAMVVPIQSEIKSNRQKYDEGLQTAESYVANDDRLQFQLSEIQSKNSELYKAEAKRNKVFDWKNARQFWIGFGVRLPYVFYALMISLFIVAQRTKDWILKIAYFLLQTHCWGIATYLMIWVFWTSDDFDLRTYRYYFIASSFVAGACITLFFTWRKTKIQKLYKINRMAFRFMFDEVDQKDYVKPEERLNYRKDRLSVAKKAVEIEQGV